MHKSAFKVGGLVIEAYGAGPGTRILEIGAYDVNGTLRQHVGPDMQYVGIDLESGPGVDIVVEPGAPLPFEDQSFDLILASSVFEHDPAFWSTFLEMIRVVQDGGYIYINAPSNGSFHRYPEDHWRFYPDSGMALQRWAESQGRSVELIESFLSEQDEDQWNDFSAIFRRLPAGSPRPGEFVYSQVSSYNVHNWQTSELIRPQDETQDMLLISAAHRRVQQQQQACDVIQVDLDRAREQLGNAEQRVESMIELAASQEKRLVSQDDELRKSRGQLASLRSEIADLHGANIDYVSEIDRLRSREQELTLLEREREELYQRNLCSLHRMEAVSVGRLTEVRALTQKLADSHKNARVALRAVEALSAQNARNAERFEAELASKSWKLTEAHARLSESERRATEADWLRDVLLTLASRPLWWSLLPPSRRQAQELKRLQANGLFDAGSYLERYPDVAESGMNPFRHYIRHGMAEGRSRFN